MINPPKLVLIFVALIMLTVCIKSQVVSGIILDSEDESAIPYVNIGIIGKPIGTTSDEAGEYKFDYKNITADSKVRFSCIGYKSKTYTLEELSNIDSEIRLVKGIISIEEVFVSDKKNPRTIGTSKVQNRGGLCGWGGTHSRQGYEIGLLINFGHENVKIKDINIKIHKQSFDTAMLRLHIRRLEDEIPSKELLSQNIFLKIVEPSGWQKIDLCEYNLRMKGEVVLSLEWVKASNVILRNMLKMNEDKRPTPIVLFNQNKKIGTSYYRKGSEAKWRIVEDSSPGIFLTVE